MEIKKYICQYCGKEFNNPHKLGGHKVKCKFNPKYNEIIKKWKQSFIKSLYENKNGFNNLNKEQILYCQHCGKECKSLNSLINHERLCKENPNRQESPFVNYNKNRIEYSNQYIKAKELGLPKPQMSNKGKESVSKIWKGKKLPEEMKQKISNSYKKFLEDNPNMVGFIRNHSSKQSYPEQYFEEVFKNENIPLKYHKQVGRYELDFYNEDLMKYVEIDGEQHYKGKMIEHDKNRTEYLKNLGWNGIRIRWAEYKKLSEKDKNNKINEIKIFLNN